jgi:dihydrofolate synthase/folylpolyglutamate synthase
LNRHPVLDQLAMRGVRLGLDRIESFLISVGEPHRAYPVIHVAGTNGKGSVCALVTASLVAAGYRVGTTISPHLEHLNERVQIDGQPIDDASLTEAIEHIDRARWDWARSAGVAGNPLTYFEYMIAVAFWEFARRQVDVAVVEVGLGGRLDATNVVDPLVCAIPHIGLDHTDQLGNTLAEIAGEKAGIIKDGVPVVLGPLSTEARERIEAWCRRKRADVWRTGTKMRREFRHGEWSLTTPGGSLANIELGLEGRHQGANALVALGVIHRLRSFGFLVDDAAIRTGFAAPGLAGRIDRLIPGLVADGAHNIDGTRALAEWLGDQPRPETRILLWGMGKGRDPVATIEPLLPWVDEVVTTRCAHPRAYDPLELARALQDIDTVISAGGDIEETLPEVFAEAHETVVAGSLFMAGAARSLVWAGALDGIEPGQNAGADVDDL